MDVKDRESRCFRHDFRTFGYVQSYNPGLGFILRSFCSRGYRSKLSVTNGSIDLIPFHPFLTMQAVQTYGRKVPFIH